MTTTLKLVETIKSEEQDFEWYPTTTAMLELIKNDFGDRTSQPSVLDCGAGDGRALIHLTRGDRYAIEKSEPLIQAMDESIFIVGTEFKQQTLIDKKVDIVFCNPPYSEFSEWMLKVIKEANAGVLYFVVPTRWVDNEEILEAIELRKSSHSVLSTSDFLNAERQARAKVDIVKIDLRYREWHECAKTDPFNIWFDEAFNLDINKKETSKYDWRGEAKSGLENGIVEGSDVIAALERLYQADLAKLMNNYKALETVDPVLLKELDVNLEAVKGALRQKVEGLKDIYWQELFDRLDTITDRLCTSSRQAMLDRLHRHVHVDFTAKNAYAILAWVVKNANKYFDSQLVDLVEKTTERASIVLYKSNQRVYSDNDWRWSRTPGDLERYALEYRIVLNRVGGISNSSWSWENERHNGLVERAAHYIDDVLTVAHNLGFERLGGERATKCAWESNQAVHFHFKDHRTGEPAELMKVRAFKNGNLHIHFNQAFMGRLNVEFGRLKGWIQRPSQAAQEMGVSEEIANTAFKSNLRLVGSNLQALSFSPEEKPELSAVREAASKAVDSNQIEEPPVSMTKESVKLSDEQQMDLLSLIDAM